MKTYNKLVRDNIPEIIKASGKTFDIHYAKKEEVLPLLETKLNGSFNSFIKKNRTIISNIKGNTMV